MKIRVTRLLLICKPLLPHFSTGTLRLLSNRHWGPVRRCHVYVLSLTVPGYHFTRAKHIMTGSPVIMYHCTNEMKQVIADKRMNLYLYFLSFSRT